MLFFNCAATLFSPVYRRGEPVRWGLLSYTVIVFSLATVTTVMNLHIRSISYIDNRKFPGVKGRLPPGPLGYLYYTSPEAVSIIPNVAFLLNNWLADGLLVSSLFNAAFTRPGV